MTTDEQAARTYWVLLGIVLCAMICGGILGWALRGWA